MSLMTLFITAVGLSMDAFAVAICKGLAVKKAGIKQMVLAGLWFGGFQALMPFIGYLFGSTLKEYVEKYDHWIAFILLGLIGFNMIKEALSKDDDCDCESKSGSMAVKEMFTLAVATSIDALIVGVGYAFLPDVNIGAAVGFIGVITFVLSAIGIKIGNVFGMKFKSKAEITGGVILILMGLKILLEHLGIINF
ncbi:MAG: manganese efflux pump [Clostridia bacterium]|nr:manganese efflux pump [Clostridia bacterium]